MGKICHTHAENDFCLPKIEEGSLFRLHTEPRKIDIVLGYSRWFAGTSFLFDFRIPKLEIMQCDISQKCSRKSCKSGIILWKCRQTFQHEATHLKEIFHPFFFKKYGNFNPSEKLLDIYEKLFIQCKRYLEITRNVNNS